MAVLVRTNHRAVQVRRERAIRHGERKRQVAVAVVAARVEEIARVFEPVLHVDALGVRRQIHAPRHLRAKRRLGMRFPRLVALNDLLLCALIFIVVFTIAQILSYLIKKAGTDKMNDALNEFQKEHQEDGYEEEMVDNN